MNAIWWQSGFGALANFHAGQEQPFGSIMFQANRPRATG